MSVSADPGTDEKVREPVDYCSIAGMVREESQHNRVAEYHAHRPAAIDGQIYDAREKYVSSVRRETVLPQPSSMTASSLASSSSAAANTISSLVLNWK